MNDPWTYFFWTFFFKEKYAMANLRGGVSSDIMIAIGPVKLPQNPLKFDGLISLKAHQSNCPRFIMRSALTATS